MSARVLAAGLLAVVLAFLAAPAVAVPSGGASPDTAGTSVTVSPGRLTAGATISFRVSGFPAGEVVYVKIDDGGFCSESGVHGACVVHQQRIPASGPVVGSLVLPADLRAGAHWLRFLASKEMRGADGSYAGVKGYSLRGNSDFTVVAASSGGAAAGPTQPSAQPTTSGTTPAPGVAVPEDTTAVAGAGAVSAGAVLGVTPAPSGPSATASAAGQPAPAAAPAVAPAAIVRQESADERFPVVGIVGLAVLCALAGWLVLRSRRA